MSYNKKQKKHTRAIFLNTQDAYYVSNDRTRFSFKTLPINVEDESLLYVKNTSINYNTSGLSVKQVNTPVWTPSIGGTYGAFYTLPPAISFVSQDGKGSGASAVSILASSGLTATPNITATALGVVNGGSGYTGSALQNVSTFTSTTGEGQNASVLPTLSTSTTGLVATLITPPTGATGGANTAGTSERWLLFPYSGTLDTKDYTFTTTEPIYGSVLVVGGGGSGGRGGGNGGTGGGGGGAVIYAQDVLFPAGNFIVRVGKGGAITASDGDPILGNGGDSSINYNGVDIYLAKGGGGGASGGIENGANGGSGGGGSGLSSAQYRLGGSAVSTNIPAVLNGNNGGLGGNFGSSSTGGGGGGAGGAGGNSFQPPNLVGVSGSGGAGLAYNMTGSSSFFGAGGGGGGVQGTSSAGTGGSAVGGNGSTSSVGGNGTSSTGSGGGGGGRASGGVPNNGGSGGSGVVWIRYYINGTASATGSFTAGTLSAGTGYTNLPTINIPAPPPTTPATFDAVPFTPSTGTITGVPNVLNRTTNGYYNAGTFTISFQNNPVIAQGFCNTNASGGLTNIIITNPADNGYYSSSAPLTITSINGILLGAGFGIGLTYTPTYTGGRCVSIIITNAGTGYGNNLAEAPITFSYPSPPSTLATITGRAIAEGHLIRLVLGTGGAGYKNPTILIDPASIVPPVQAVYAPVYKIPTAIQGVRMLNYGKGYTLPPRVLTDQTFKIPTSTQGQDPLYAEMTPTNLLQPNYYYTIKADGFSFNRTLYTNQDNKGMPTVAICSTSEIINNEDYIELVLQAQTINDLTLEVKERDGSGLAADQNLSILMEVAELDVKDSSYYQSKRQEY